MTQPEPDDRSPERKALDEKIAAEAHAPIPPLPPDAPRVPVEELLRQRRRKPLAVAIRIGLTLYESAASAQI